MADEVELVVFLGRKVDVFVEVEFQRDEVRRSGLAVLLFHVSVCSWSRHVQGAYRWTPAFQAEKARSVGLESQQTSHRTVGSAPWVYGWLSGGIGG